MPDSLSEPLLALQRKAQKFAEFLHSETDAKRMVQASKEAGFFGMTQPAAFGGAPGSTLELTIVREALAAANAPHADLVFGPGPGVLAGCNDRLRKSHLEPMLAGDLRGSFGFTEPDDAPEPTSAVLEGDNYIVRGQKSYVTGGGSADFINTLVRINGESPAMMVIDTSTPGVVLERRFSSLDGSHHAAFRFDDVRVPKHHLIGEPGDGMPRAMRQIGDTRLAIAASCVGWLLWVTDFTEQHIRAPDRTGEPRAAKEGVRLRYSDLRIQTFAARSMLYRTARLADAGENVVNEAISCKVFSTEAIGTAVDTAIQLVGGSALVEGHPLEAMYRRVRALRLAEGASDVLRLNLVRGNLELGKGRL